jgi:type IV pilus assembly protein PilV
MKHDASPGSQAGIALIEALIAILIISFGILGIIGLQANSIAFVSDARYRVDAAALADRLIGEMWVNAGSGAVNFPNSALYVWDGVGAPPAGLTTPPVTIPPVAGDMSWLDALRDRLPGTTNPGNNPIITVDGNGLVTITIRWTPSNTGGAAHTHRVIANIGTLNQELN